MGITDKQLCAIMVLCVLAGLLIGAAISATISEGCYTTGFDDGVEYVIAYSDCRVEQGISPEACEIQVNEKLGIIR